MEGQPDPEGGQMKNNQDRLPGMPDEEIVPSTDATESGRSRGEAEAARLRQIAAEDLRGRIEVGSPAYAETVGALDDEKTDRDLRVLEARRTLGIEPDQDWKSTEEEKARKTGPTNEYLQARDDLGHKRRPKAS